jgi:hypothetical protein
VADWWAEIVPWDGRPRYEPAPPVDENPWYDAPLPLEPEHQDPHDGAFVYLMESGGAYKIGISRDVPSRMRDLNCAAADRVELLAMRRGSARLESRLHRRLHAYRMNGEWFKACEAVYEAFYQEPEHDPVTAHNVAALSAVPAAVAMTERT